MTNEHFQTVMKKFRLLTSSFDCEEELRSASFMFAHYTSVSVAEQILKSQELWFSHPFYMNDLDELHWGMRAGFQIFPEFAQKASNSHAEAEALIKNFYHYIQHMEENTLVDTYIFCVSEHQHQNTDGTLSMWRSYANQGHGAALIFDPTKLDHVSKTPFRFAKIKYLSNPDRINFLRGKLEEWANTCRLSNFSQGELTFAAYAAFLFVKDFALMTKHIGFKEENEWRLIHTRETDPGESLIDQTGYLITPKGAEPKLKFKINSLVDEAGLKISLSQFLALIILGPSASSPIAKKAFCRILKGTCLETFEDRVICSTIPLRPMH